MQQGFDYCYDKRLYDRLLGGQCRRGAAPPARRPRRIRTPWSGSWRITTSRGPPRRSRPAATAAAVAALTQTGARLIHHGQLLGWRVRLPVFLGRFPAEPADDQLAAFYRRLLAAARRPDLSGRALATV